jgi:hypothetical protein
MIDDPISNPRAWYVMKVGATPTPGKCEVTAERVNRINVMMGLGSDGASTVYVGREVIVAQATFWAWQTTISPPGIRSWPSSNTTPREAFPCAR